MTQQAQSATSADRHVTAADELFVNLDRSLVYAEGGCWQIEICGIHHHADTCWLQLSLIGRDRHLVTVRSDSLSVAAIREQLADWLNHVPVGVPVHGTAA